MNLLLGLPLGLFHLLGVVLMAALRLAPLILVAVVGIRLYRKHSGTAEKAEKPPKEEKRGPKFTGPVYTVDYKEVREEEVSARKEPPAAFGYKPCWLLVRSHRPETVMELLGLKNRKHINWTAGLAGVAENRWFVTPSLGGWVAVIGADTRPQPEEQLAQLSRRCGEVQTFVSDREQARFGWSLYRSGACVRAYSVSGGQVVLDQGELTEQEITLGFGRFPRKGSALRESDPDSDAVLAIAAAWGLDPMLEGCHFPPSAGWLCEAD